MGSLPVFHHLQCLKSSNKSLAIYILALSSSNIELRTKNHARSSKTPICREGGMLKLVRLTQNETTCRNLQISPTGKKYQYHHKSRPGIEKNEKLTAYVTHLDGTRDKEKNNTSFHGELSHKLQRNVVTWKVNKNGYAGMLFRTNDLCISLFSLVCFLAFMKVLATIKKFEYEYESEQFSHYNQCDFILPKGKKNNQLWAPQVSNFESLWTVTINPQVQSLCANLSSQALIFLICFESKVTFSVKLNRLCNLKGVARFKDKLMGKFRPKCRGESKL